MKNIAIIPARGGSKRIPEKNIKLFLGKPIIEYSIEVAINSGLFDVVMVSTDDEKIAKIALKAGASVPFFRSKETSGDKVGIAEVLIEVLNLYKKEGIVFENCCCIFACAPFITKGLLQKSFNVMVNGKFDALFPLVPYPVPIQQSFKINPENKRTEMFFDDQAGIMTQDYVPSYYDAGQYYWMTTKSVLKNNRIDVENTGSIILSDLDSHDIDTEEDWKMAEFKYKYVKNQNL